MKWITAQAINYHWNISIRAHNLTKKLQGTPHIKRSNIRCGRNGSYWLYSLDYIINMFGDKPIPQHIIRQA